MYQSAPIVAVAPLVFEVGHVITGFAALNIDVPEYLTNLELDACKNLLLASGEDRTFASASRFPDCLVSYFRY
jgi:hypothetical protein